MTIKCLIIDDEQPARELLKSYVEKVPQLHLVELCKSPFEALSIMKREQIDLLLLDVQMPDLNGTDMLRCIIDVKPLIIFTTAAQEYALEGYELDAIDYMLKPIRFERFMKGIQKVLKQKELLDYKNQSTTNLVPISVQQDKDYIVLKTNQKLYKVPFSEILYIEGMKEYVVFYTKSQKLVIHTSLKLLEQNLPEDDFLRVHKSYIVNKKEVSNMFGNQLAIGEKYIPIGYSYKQIIIDKIF